VSPSRSRRQAPQRRQYSQREIVIAVLGALAVVVFTVFAIWIMRPGDSLTPGTGGLAHRQPRATWLVVGALVFVIVGLVLIFRMPKARRRSTALVPAVVIVAVVGSIAAGFLWPGGLQRHYQSLKAPDIPATTTPRPTGTTGETGTTTATTPPTTGAAPTTATTGG
jgi:hypothetical protein